MLRELMADRNPVRAMLNDRMEVSLAGSITLSGQPCAILRATGPRIRLSLMVRRSDGLLVGTTSESLDQSGTVISSSERRIEYLSVKERLPATAFVVSTPGYRKASLAAIR
jgi:hypothetical protein